MAPDLSALVDHLRHDPGDDAARAILADLLDDLGPTPVERGHVPNWLRLCWVRQVPDALRWPRRRHGNFAVAREVGAFLQAQPDHLSRWDHWGRSKIAALDVLISEPYGAGENAHALFRPLSEVLPGCAHAFARNGAWNNGTYRAILFPPLEMPPPKKRRGSRGSQS